MDAFVGIVAFLFSVAFTALLYGIGPVALVHFRKKPLAKWKLIAFSVSYSLVAWFSINIVNVLLLDGEVSSGGAMLMWGFIFYRRASEKLCDTTLSGQPLETWYTCPACGCLVRTGEICDCKKIANASEPDEIVLTYIRPSARLDSPPRSPSVRKNRINVPALVLSFLLAVSVVANLLQFEHYEKLAKNIEELQFSLEREQELTEALKEVRSRLVNEIRGKEPTTQEQSVVVQGEHGRLVKIK